MVTAEKLAEALEELAVVVQEVMIIKVELQEQQIQEAVVVLQEQTHLTHHQ